MLVGGFLSVVGEHCPGPTRVSGPGQILGNEAVCCYEAEMLKDPENLLRKVILITKEKIEELCARNVLEL